MSKGFRFVEKSDIDGGFLSCSQLHEKGKIWLGRNIANVPQYIWYASDSDGEFIDTKISGNNEQSGMDSFKVARLQNPKNINFSYIHINSIRNKFRSLCSLISSHVDILSIAETKLDYSFPNSQFLIPNFHQPFRLDISRNSGGFFVCVRFSIPARILSNYRLQPDIQAKPFEIKLGKEKWLFISAYKPSSLNNQHLRDSLSELLDFYSRFCDNKVVFCYFNLEISHLVMSSFMNNENFINPVKGNTCFKGKGSCIDMILTNRRYSFKYTSSIETGLSDHHYLISSMMKTTFEKEEPKVSVYQDYKNFSALIVLSLNCCLKFITIMWFLLPLKIIL